LLVFGVAFVIALNLAVRLDHSTFLVPQIVGIQSAEPGQAIRGESPEIEVSVLLKEWEAEVNSENLRRLQTWSILAVIGLAVSSGIGGYVLSGVMLRPVRDITSVASEISATNLERRINYEGPADEMKDLADTFDSMIARLERSFESQRRFVQDASHELRTPLAAIRTNIEVTEMDGDASLEDYRQLLDTVKTQTARLARLSDDLMLLTTGGDGEPLELDPVELSSLAAEVLDQLRPVADQRHVQLKLESPLPVWACAKSDLLYRCVFNLVDNAIKYSGEGAHVEVRCSMSGSRALVEVRDDGPGIPLVDRLHIFDRFYRVDRGRSRREGGSGLGLAIVRELSEAMGGDVRVDSNEGDGSVFTVSMASGLN
jgi:signal transduction histidine kinase